MNKNIIILIELIIIAALASLLFYFGKRSNVQPKPYFLHKIDTLIKEIPAPPVIITKAKMKIVKLKDTVILTSPFIARLDTIIQRDTVRASYEFPANLLSLELRKKPDSIITRNITMFKTIEKERAWWEAPAFVIVGAAAGVIIGVVVK